MPTWFRHVAAGTAARVPALLTLLLLAAVGVWGALHEWKLPPLAKLWGNAAPQQEEEPGDAIKVIRSAATPPSEDPDYSVYHLARIQFPSAEAVEKAEIHIEPARSKPMAPYISAYAALDYEPSRYAQLNSRVSGTIWRVLKELGEPVRKGEVLALIESSEGGQAKADFQQALLQLRLQKQNWQSVEKLSEKGTLSETRYREAQTALTDAHIHLANAHQRVLNLGLSLRLRDVENLAEDQLPGYLRLLDIPEKIRQKEDTETLTANLVPLKAPFNGQVVMHPHAAPGEVVNTSLAREPMFIVADVSHLHIDLDVQPGDVGQLRIGQEVTFYPEDKDAAPAVGKIAHISPEVNEKTRHVEVHAEVENPDGRLRPHTFGTGQVRTSTPHDAVVVPNTAVQSDGKASFVFVRLTDEVFEARQVRPGLRDEKDTEINGVREGEMVVTQGSYALKSELLKDRIGAAD